MNLGYVTVNLMKTYTKQLVLINLNKEFNIERYLFLRLFQPESI